MYIPLKDQAALGGDGGAPAAFKNDGSFLERMKKELAGRDLDSSGGSKAVAAS